MANSRMRLVVAAISLFFVSACWERPASPPGEQNNGGPAPAAGGRVDPAAEPLDPCANVLLEAKAAPQNPPADGAALNRLDLKADGRLVWNGAEIDTPTLRQYVELLSQMTPEPTLIISLEDSTPAAARIELAEAVRDNFHCRIEGL